MDRLFKKKSSAATSKKSARPGTAPTLSPAPAAKPPLPPSIDLDIRSSLILPSLSQRFSVLLPSLSTAPEDSLRSLLASQRAHLDGPSLTLEEEELLFAEIHGAPDNWDGRAPAIDWGGSASPTPFPTSFSSPSVLSDEPLSASTSAFSLSPLPTSTSDASFNTFGGGHRSRSHGFGSSALRDGDYIRRVKKSASKGNLTSKDASARVSNMTTSSSGASEGSPGANGAVNGQSFARASNPPISPAQANTAYKSTTSVTVTSSTGANGDRSESPTANHTTSTSAVEAMPPRARASPSATSALLPPQQPSPISQPPLAPQDGNAPKRRASLLAGLSPAQVKRISRALLEIESKLEKEKIGEHVVSEEIEADDSAPEPDAPTSTSSNAVTTPPSTHAPLPPSPRMRDLQAHVEPAVPVLAPVLPIAAQHLDRSLRSIRPLSAKHTPTASIASSSSPQASSPVPGYVPGQMRPVGSHRAHPSVSSTASPAPSSPALAQSRTASAPGRNRSGSTPSARPPIIGTRSNPLGRSLSVNHDRSRSVTPTQASPEPAVVATVPFDSFSTRASPAFETSAHSAIQEDEVEDDVDTVPEVRVMPERHSVSESTRDARGSLDSTRSGLAASAGHDVYLCEPNRSRIAVVEQLSRGSSIQDRSPAFGLQRFESSESLHSTYDDKDDTSLGFGGLGFLVEDSPLPAEDVEFEGELLRKHSGVRADDLLVIQSKLVDKAKQEREELRNESPIVPTLPPVQECDSRSSKALDRAKSPTSLAPDLALARNPPTAWRFPPAGSAPSAAAPSTHSIASPERATSPAGAPVPALGTSMVETPVDDHIHTPASELSHKSSGKARKRADEDPDVRRDFEERIKAATAALNGTPSRAGNHDKGTHVPKRAPGPIVISSPTLMSSSARLPATPTTPREPGQHASQLTGPFSQSTAHGRHASRPDVESGMSRAFEKTSGSGSKMSLRWKKLVGKKPSVSGKVLDASHEPFKAPPTRPHNLDAPIALKRADAPPAPPSNMAGFRFPHAATVTSPPHSAVPPPSARLGSPIPPPPTSAPLPLEAAGPSAGARPPQDVSAMHSPTSSSDSAAIAKFFEAGRAVGLDEVRLNEMLVATGLNRSATTASSRSYQSTAPTSNSISSPVMESPTVQSSKSGPAVAAVARSDSAGRSADTASSDAAVVRKGSVGKGAKKLLRSLSKGGRKTPVPEPDVDVASPRPSTTQQPRSEANGPASTEREQSVLRRTMIISTDFAHLANLIPPTPPQPYTPDDSRPQATFPSSVLESPESAQPGARRKSSIKRKPLKLSGADRELVQLSPKTEFRRDTNGTGRTVSATSSTASVPASTNTTSGHAKDMSSTSTVSGLSGMPIASNGASHDVVGLGFLEPAAAARSTTSLSPSPRVGSFQSRESAGASIYDYYGDDGGAWESLRDRSSLVGRNQAVEVVEFADGRVVWNVVDGLRDGLRSNSISDVSVGPRDSSYSYLYNLDSPRAPPGTLEPARRESDTVAVSRDEPGRWGMGGTKALNLRHRDRGKDDGPRPDTRVFYTSSADVADLIDQLSRDSLGAARGRIDIMSRPPPSTSSSPPLPSTAAGRRPPPMPISPPRASANVPAGGFSPKRQLFLKQHAHRRAGSNASASYGQTPSHSIDSPSQASFSTGISDASGQGKSVEDRLQALMDRLRTEPI
ncbi:hypothetical protein Q5752_004777 [Cryptotrichosporon argae]